MIMDTLGTLRKSLSRMLWSWGGVSSSSSWKTAKSHALNHPSKPTRFLVNHIDWKGRWKVVWNLVQYSWKSNRANQGFWQKRCLMETQGVQWACGLRMVGTCYLEIGKGSPEPREANPCWLHVTTWDFFWDNFEITNSIKFHRSTLSIFSRSVNWGPNFQSAALTGFHCTQVRCKPGAIEGRKCWPVFATCLNKTLVKLCGNHAWRDQIYAGLGQGLKLSIFAIPASSTCAARKCWQGWQWGRADHQSSFKKSWEEILSGFTILIGFMNMRFYEQ